MASATQMSWARLRWRLFLTYLAVERNVSASTQNQAKSALLYLYKEVLGAELLWLDEVTQAKTHCQYRVQRKLL